MGKCPDHYTKAICTCKGDEFLQMWEYAEVVGYINWEAIEIKFGKEEENENL